MKVLFDFFPILCFFLAYRLFDIYVATAVAMGASLVQVVCYRIKHQYFDKMHLISCVIIMVLGGATLFFHNPWFIKWKPTGIYWLMSIIILGSQWIGSKPVIRKMMEQNILLPEKVWARLNLAWAAYFLLLGGLNLYIAYYFSTEIWVNFKLFGGAGLTLLFVLLQALYLTKHLVGEKKITNRSCSLE